MEVSMIRDVSVADFLQVISDHNIPILDVRTPAEYAAGHLERAINVDIYNERFVDMIDALKLSPTAPIAVYCHSGARSRHAAEMLPWIGYKGPIYNLRDGYMAYEMSQMYK